MSSAARHASENAGDSGDSSIFSSVLSRLTGNKESIAQEDVDEDHAVEAHKQFYGNNGSGQQPASDSNMGAAAAMQALKMFTGGSGGNASAQQSSGSQNQFIGMAMAQASKLFDQQSAQGNADSSASKESVVQKAGEMALKMYMKKQLSGGSSGGSSGLGGLMSMASKFL